MSKLPLTRAVIRDESHVFSVSEGRVGVETLESLDVLGGLNALGEVGIGPSSRSSIVEHLRG